MCVCGRPLSIRWGHRPRLYTPNPLVSKSTPVSDCLCKLLQDQRRISLSSFVSVKDFYLCVHDSRKSQDLSLLFLFSEFTYRCNLETRRVMKNYIMNTSACTLWGYSSCQNNRGGHGLTFSLDELIIFTSRPLNLHVNQALNFFWESGPVYILISLYNYTPSCDKNPGDLEVWIMLIMWGGGLREWWIMSSIPFTMT